MTKSLIVRQRGFIIEAFEVLQHRSLRLHLLCLSCEGLLLAFDGPLQHTDVSTDTLHDSLLRELEDYLYPEIDVLRGYLGPSSGQRPGVVSGKVAMGRPVSSAASRLARR
jgi:hypothetical protein